MAQIRNVNRGTTRALNRYLPWGALLFLASCEEGTQEVNIGCGVSPTCGQDRQSDQCPPTSEGCASLSEECEDGTFCDPEAPDGGDEGGDEVSAGEVDGKLAGDVAGVESGGEGDIAGSEMTTGGLAGDEAGGEIEAGEVIGGEETTAGAGVTAGEQAGELAGGMIATSPLNAFTIEGSWARCQSETARSLKLTYTFVSTGSEIGTWAYREERFGEDNCLGEPSITLFKEGSFEFGQPSDMNEQMRFVTLTYEALKVRPDNQNSAELLQSAICPEYTFTQNELTDVSDQGCPRLGLYSINDCPQRFDRLYLENDELSLGLTPTEPQSLCEEMGRPRARGEGFSRQ